MEKNYVYLTQKKTEKCKIKISRLDSHVIVTHLVLSKKFKKKIAKFINFQTLEIIIIMMCLLEE